MGVTSPNLFIIRVFQDDCGWSYSSSIANAALECANNGADIINMSLAGSGYSSYANSVFQNLYNNGVLTVAAAGNDGGTSYVYPASFDGVISVGAVDSNENAASFSQSNDRVSISAPGVAVKSTLPGNRYASWSGTSMATPHVAGVAALIWSHYPTATSETIKNAMISTAKSKGSDLRYGAGIVQAELALAFLAPSGPVCGDNSCDIGEDLSTCPQDCGFCGDTFCDLTEDASTCPQDCDPCGNGICESGETFTSCPADCPPPPPQCGKKGATCDPKNDTCCKFCGGRRGIYKCK